MPWRARLVIGAPRALHRDPLFEEVETSAPSITAWAELSTRGEVDPQSLARVQRALAEGTLDGVGLACALPVLAADEDDGAPGRVARASEALGGAVPDDLAVRAAILTALASLAPGVNDGGQQQLAALLAKLRLDGWRALASAPDRPAVMAQMAAALLLIDRRDVPGRALLERAVASLEEDDHGRRWVGARSTTDAFVGTLALAIAARQAEDDELADALAQSALGRMYLVPRLGAEGAFWAVAASVYGALGVDAPESADVEVDGVMRRVDLDDGVAVIEIGADTHARVSAESAVWLRTESRYLVSHREEGDGRVRAHIEGVSGRFGGRAAFELVVEDEGEQDVEAPIVELTLPGAAALDDVARSAMEQAPGLVKVDEVDGAGVVRLHLAPLVHDGAHRIPLPLAWIASGRTTGLSLRSYDASAPTEIRMTEGRTMQIRGESR